MSQQRSYRRMFLVLGLSDELRAIVGTNVLRDAMQDKEIGEHVDDIDGFQLPVDPNGQTFVCELVDDV